AKFRRKDQDEDLETGDPVDPVGDFRDDKFGFAEETKGDPYFQDLIGDLLAAGGEYPTLANAEGVPIGCLDIDRDGKVVDTLFKEKSGNDEEALRRFQEARAADPKNSRIHLNIGGLYEKQKKSAEAIAECVKHCVAEG
ncbi:MAG: hypothetical protein AAB327_03850, partial [Actinomycetota bacterium]